MTIEKYTNNRSLVLVVVGNTTNCYLLCSMIRDLIVLDIGNQISRIRGHVHCATAATGARACFVSVYTQGQFGGP